MDDASAFAGSVEAFLHQRFSRGDAVKAWVPATGAGMTIQGGVSLFRRRVP
jgi:hypothetical protein